MTKHQRISRDQYLFPIRSFEHLNATNEINRCTRTSSRSGTMIVFRDAWKFTNKIFDVPSAERQGVVGLFGGGTGLQGNAVLIAREEFRLLRVKGMACED